MSGTCRDWYIDGPVPRRGLPAEFLVERGNDLLDRHPRIEYRLVNHLKLEEKLLFPAFRAVLGSVADRCTAERPPRTSGESRGDQGRRARPGGQFLRFARVPYMSPGQRSPNSCQAPAVNVTESLARDSSELRRIAAGQVQCVKVNILVSAKSSDPDVVWVYPRRTT